MEKNRELLKVQSWKILAVVITIFNASLLLLEFACRRAVWERIKETAAEGETMWVIVMVGGIGFTALAPIVLWVGYFRKRARLEKEDQLREQNKK